jgi:para-nitrobenzyl esterase
VTPDVSLPGPLVSTPDGDLLGRRIDGVLEWRGIPYAKAARFVAPGPVAPWRGVREALEYGPSCPQPDTTLVEVLGPPPNPLPRSEDCLHLTVTAPERKGALRPVLVWLHGGSYMVGSGSIEHYRPHKMVREGDVVVVRINYRLGVLGYLQLDGVSPGNLGLLDQIAALAWVRRNIASFGGDPERVTVFGQSAGADSVACLIASPLARGLFRRAVVQSAPFGARETGADYARRTAGYLVSALRGADPRSVSIGELLDAQSAAVMVADRREGSKSAMPYGPVVGGAVLPRHPFDTDGPARTEPLDVIVGWTRDDVSPFVYLRPDVQRLVRLPFAPFIVEGVTAGLTRWVFGRPAMRLANALTATGARVYTYRIDWAAPAFLMGACHCIDLPLLLGDETTWREAPMIGGASWSTIDELGARMRGAWSSFARDGEPIVPGSPWRAHERGAKVGMRWDA